VPLLASTQSWDQFTSVKWYGLAVLAALLLASELVSGPVSWPWGLRRAFLPCLALFVLPLPGALEGGIGWAAPALLERLVGIALVLSFFWYFRARGASLPWVQAGLITSLGVTTAVGLAQAIGVQPFPSLTSGDHRSALFGNVNMAAEFTGFAFVVLLARDRPTPATRKALWLEALLAFSAVLLVLLASRSALLALCTATVSLLVVRRVDPRRLGRLALAAAVGGALFLGLGSLGREGGVEARHLLRGDVQQNKRDSSGLRFAAWQSAWALVHDHPLGVGLGNFPDAFIPYQLEGAKEPSETLYFRSPHNEALRIAAEGGWIALLLALGLGLALARALWREPRVARGRTEAGATLLAGGLYYAVQALFQFPTEVAFGTLAMGGLLGLALACLEPGAEARPGDPRTIVAWRLVGAAAVVVLALWTWRIARSEWLFVAAPRDLEAQEEACRLNPRNLPACVSAAWLLGRAGRDGEAQGTLREVLLRSPHYFPAIKLLGEQALHRGDHEAGCRYLWVYDELFRRKSTVHARLGRHCAPEQFERFRDTIRMPRYAAFPFATGSGR
jgi:O-antigen ligase